MRSGRLLTGVGLVFLLQLALMFWLSDSAARGPVFTPPVPSYRMSDPAARPAPVAEDPTLFVLPRRESFSGAVWMENEKQTFAAPNRTEPPRLLELSPRELGASFVQFVRTEAQPKFESTPLFEPTLILPPPMPTLPIVQPVTLRVQGELAERTLSAVPELAPKPGIDLLTNSVVQVTVDARGRVFSAVLRDRAGARDNPFQAAADSNALYIARQLQFEPLPLTAAAQHDLFPELTIGTLEFQWQTVSTNSAASTLVP